MKSRYILSICLVFIAVALSTSTGSAESKPASDQEEYFAVFMEGKKVGHAVQNRVVTGGKVTTSENVSITVSRANVSVTIEMVESSIETTKGEPLGFEATQQLGAMVMNVSGRVDKQGKVSLTTTSMPGILQALDTQIHIGPKQNIDLLGRVVALREVTTTLIMPGAGEIVSTSYVDEDLRVQKSIMPMAGMRIEMIACAKEFALGKNDILELIDKMFLASPEPLDNVGSAKSITYHLSPKEETADFTIPSNDSQKVQQLKNGRVILTVKPNGQACHRAGRSKVSLQRQGQDHSGGDQTNKISPK
ncbi:MAG: hypothetical protein ACYTFW_25500 [Planctomycetota bacterium]|jgi:hypothetical protein